MTLFAAMPALLTVLAAGSPAPRAAVVVHATGFPDATVKTLERKIGAEVESAGAEPWSLSGALEIRPECLQNEGCAKEVLSAAESSRLVWVEILRVGAKAQLSGRFLDENGRILAQAERSAAAEELLGPMTLLPPEVRAELVAAVSAAQAAPPQSAVAAPVVEPEVAANAEGLPPLAIAGIAMTGAGTLLALGSIAVIPAELAVIDDPKSLGSEKEGAAGVAVLAGSLGVVGAVAAIAGGVLLALTSAP